MSNRQNSNDHAFRSVRAGLLCLFLLAAACAPSRPEAPPAVPRRIISVVPSVTETLFALGLKDKVIAVGDYDQFPPEVAQKPRAGGLINPNIELIISLHPDLVITYGTQQLTAQRLQSTGIRLIPFVHGNVEQTLDFMLELGAATGAADRARALVDDIRKTFAEVRSAAPRTRLKVLLAHSRGAGTLGSFYSVGSRAFQDDLMGIAGGENIFADVDRETVQPTLEEVIRRKPDIVLETLSSKAEEEEIKQRKKDWETLGLPPDRVYIETESYFLVPGPRMALAARRLGEIFREAGSASRR
jgi:ABC-type Fe3+-hydroxamate transport system substrate-binding protein